MKSPFQIVTQLLLSFFLLFVSQAWALDLNQASSDELQSISGVGPKMAQRIVKERARGPFQSLEHLAERVSGVGVKRIERFKAAGLTVGSIVRSAVGSADQHPSNPVRINTLKSGALKSNAMSKNSVRTSRSPKAQSPPITPEIWLIDHALSNP